VIGTTRHREKTPLLRALGVTPVVVDVLDEAALRRAVADAEPAIVIHQLTDLPPGLDPAQMPAARERNAHLREVGTRHLVAAAVAAGARRLIAQSIAFAYAPGPRPYAEQAPLDVDAVDPGWRRTVRAVASLEQQVLGAGLAGIVLRYGRLYGPGTGVDRPPSSAALHVDAAADAARRALTLGDPGVYNIAEDDGTVASTKAMAAFGWRPDFRLPAT
jgi:nucleoside-diphosphate-sugar epimerase